MSELGWLAVYGGIVLLVSMVGGYLPYFGRITHRRMQFYLSASAGVMLGASFFHVMPEAMHLAGGMFGWWMSIGVVGLFCIERFIAPHSHEMDGPGLSHAGHSDCDHGHLHTHGHTHDHGHSCPPGEVQYDAKAPTAAAPPVAGWMAVLGLTLHTFMNGVGLAGAVRAEFAHLGHDHGETGLAAAIKAWGLPGFALFLAITLHKPADALAVSMMLGRKGVSRGLVMLAQFAFAAMVPVGAACFYIADSAGYMVDIENQVTGAALAFSAGTFLFIALSDLLPEVQFHRHDRGKLFAALLGGIVLMGLIGILEGHDHGHGGHGHGGHDHGGHDHGAHHDHGDHDHGRQTAPARSGPSCDPKSGAPDCCTPPSRFDDDVLPLPPPMKKPSSPAPRP
jgi:zinc and cadmium transporter